MMHASIARLSLAWLLLLVLAAAVAGCSKKTDTEYLESAKRLHAKGDNGAAIVELKNALAQNPKNAHARFLLGTLHNESGNYREAEPDLRRAIDLGLIEGGRVHAELARSLINLSEPKKVLSDIKPLDSFEAEPLTLIHAIRGQASLQLRDRESARKSLEEAGRTGPEHPQTALLRVRILVTERNPGQALETLDALLKKHPKNLEGLMLRADLLHLVGRAPEAVAVYDTILSLRNMVPAHVARALLMIRLGKHDEAQKDVDAIRQLSPRIPVGHYLRSLLLLKQGKLGDAQSAVHEALRILPEYPDAQLLAGAIAHARGSNAHAEQLLSKYLARFPGSLTARKVLAAAQIQLGRHREAFETLQPALTDSMRDTVVLGLAGDALMNSGDLDRAGRYYERASAAKPDDPRARTSLAVLQLQRGDTEAALGELESVAKLETSEYRADRILITALYRRGEYDKALEAVRRLEAKQPKSPLPHQMAGLIALARKDQAAARKSFERALDLDPRYFVAAAGLAELDLRENRLEDARRRFERFLNKSPKHVLTMLALSEIGGRAKDAAAYVKWLEAARAADPAAVEPAARLSAYYQSQGNPAKALEHARAVASRNPSSAAALDVLGTAQMSNREFNAAAQTYLKVVELTPKHAVSHFRLAAAQQASGDLGGAEARYRKAVELDPQYVNAWIALGALQVNKGETKQALNTAATIRKLAPTAPHAHAIEGEALLREKRNAEAAKAFERALALDASGANAVKIYTARWRAGNQTGAMSGLEEWVESHPQDLAAQRVLADAYLATGRTTDAIRHYQKLAAASPKDGVVLNNLAVSYLALKDPKAEEIARRAYEVAGNEAYALDTYGWVLVEHGKVKEGLPLLEKAKSLSPKTDEISYHLAVALARSGDKVRARKELEALLALKKTSPYAQQARSLLGTL